MKYLKLEECVKGHVYKLVARNFSAGVFDGRDGFIGIRHKFGMRFLFTEYHYDCPAFPTARPLKLLGVVPDSIPLVTSLGTVNEPDGRQVEYVQGKWRYVDDGTVLEDPYPVSVPNTSLFTFLEKLVEMHDE